ncbi:MAG: aminotransferase class V-fold PLP-dependent enzyme [Bryobacteraceae bacterium]|jgi:selenocysteine lyase/cysteine desulfurase
MGFVFPEGALRDQYRPEFPVAERLIYLNHAAVSPLPRRVAEAMKQLADDSCQFGSLHYDTWLAAYEGVRVAAARLVGASRDEIAIVKNTSEGICTVAGGLEWKPGDRVVAFREEFPANFNPWKRLEAKRVQVEWLSITDPLDRVEEACRGAKLLAVSFVQYLSGLRANVKALGEICRSRGCFFFLDAIQGLGALPLDVEEAHIDALAADGHKWLLGPEGCGVLYVRREWQERIEPLEFGWTNTAHFADYSSRDLTLRGDAGRYECGTLNTIGCFGLRAALELILEADPARIAPLILARADEIAAGALAKGYEVLGDRRPEAASGIVSVRHPSLDSRLIVRDLNGRGISAAPRQGWIRFSPHFYISPEEIARVVEALPGA